MVLKRFLIFLVVILVGLSIGLTTYYMLQNEENLSIRNTIVYVNTLEYVTVEVVSGNLKAGTTFELATVSPLLEKQADGRFFTKAGGTAVITLKSSNNKFNGQTCTVIIGDGSEDYPFVIRYYGDMTDIGSAARGLDKNYIMLNDINLADQNPNQFVPVGNGDPIGFSGVFDGNGFKFHNLKITEPTGAAGETGFPETPVVITNAGLFAKIAKGGVVKNFDINNVTVSGGYQTAGSIAGINQGTVEMVRVTGGVNGKVESTFASSSVGGAVGALESVSEVARISRVSTNLTVTGKENVGAIAGENRGSLIVNCYATGAVNGISTSAVTGGIVGLNVYVIAPNSDTFKANVINCYTALSIDGQGAFSGAIIGRNTDIGTEEENVNRIYGNYYLLANNPALNGVGGVPDAGSGFVGTVASLLSELQSKEHFKTYTAAHGNLPVAWNFVDVWSINAQVNNGMPTLVFSKSRVPDGVWDPDEDFYSTINDAAGFNNIRDRLDGNFTIANHIDLSGFESWEPIGTRDAPFTGNIIVEKQGNGKYWEIQNLKIGWCWLDTGLFGVISETATLTGITLVGVNITNDLGIKHSAGVSGVNIGAVVGLSRGTLVDCSAIGAAGVNNGRININTNATDNHDVNLGAIVGRLDTGGTVTTSGAGDITTNNSNLALSGGSAAGKLWNVGGIAGLNNGDVRFAGFSGSINISGTANVNGGGVVGENYGRVVSSKGMGSIVQLNISSETFAGGLVGKNQANARILYSQAAGGISGKTAGGLIGYNEGPNGSSSMEECGIASGTVNGDLVGGLVGYHYRGIITNCFTLVTLSGKVMGGFGGIVAGTSDNMGNNISTANITYCYAGVRFNAPGGAGTAYYETSSEIRKSWTHAVMVLDMKSGDGDIRGKIGGFVLNSIINQERAGSAIRQNTSYHLFGIQLDTPNDGLRNDAQCKQFATFADRGFSFAGTWTMTGGTDGYPTLARMMK
ncbi:MAG: hypothetical protein FWE53_01755 [Firmicutes bacterium]|nr:hypothetical protein [Bacillota bacterium]